MLKNSQIILKMKKANILESHNFVSSTDFTLPALLYWFASQKNENCMSVKFLPSVSWIQSS